MYGASRVRAARVLATALLAAAAPQAGAEGPYAYITPDDLKSRIQSQAPLTILDIQVEEEFALHHIRGAVATFAYPVRSEEEKTRLEAVYPNLAGGSDPVVIVCPRGGGGAQRTYDYLVGRGMDARRLLILEKGQAGWPFPDLLEGGGK
ncbi:MAG: rhodanese-like domain-containing protein [bacterium]|nr:MAG: rhodanese-like domain-containing protein [bacterium]